MRRSTRALVALNIFFAAVALMPRIALRHGVGFQSTLFPPKESTARISRLILSSAGGAVELTRSATGWDIAVGRAAYPARGEAIESFLAALSRQRRVERVGASPATWANFALDEASAFAARAEAADGTIIGLWWFGAPDATGNGLYARTGRDLAALRVEDDLSPFLSARSAYWAELRPFPAILGMATVQSARVSRGDSTRRLGGNDARSFDEGLRSLQAVDVIDAGAQLPPADTAISLELGDARRVSFSAHALEDGDYALALDDGRKYRISAWAKRRLDAAMENR